MKISKNFLRVLIVALGIFMGLPVWGLSGLALWGISVAITTMIFLDIVLIRPLPIKLKLVCILFYIITMFCVVIWLLT